VNAAFGLLVVWLHVGTVWAASPVVGLVAEPSDVMTQYRAAAGAAGRTADAAELLCRPAFDTIQYCLTLRTADAVRWRYATRADLGLWSSEALAHQAADGASQALNLPDRFQLKKVAGTQYGYWSGDLDDGLDAAVFLQPGVLAKTVGGDAVVAAPAQGVVVFWQPGHPEQDQILAVGVKRMYEEAAHPVSPRVYRWDGKRWVVWGEAMAD
jgi:hypothetical protein